MQVMLRLLVVIRFKATDVSLSEVGCAPHLKKNSWKNEEKKITIWILPGYLFFSKHFFSEQSFGGKRITLSLGMSREEITIDFLKERTALSGAELVSNTLSIWENPGLLCMVTLSGAELTGQ